LTRRVFKQCTLGKRKICNKVNYTVKDRQIWMRVTGNKKVGILINASKFCSLEEILLCSRTPAMLLNLTEKRLVGDLHIKANKEENQTRVLVNTEINT